MFALNFIYFIFELRRTQEHSVSSRKHGGFVHGYSAVSSLPAAATSFVGHSTSTARLINDETDRPPLRRRSTPRENLELSPLTLWYNVKEAVKEKSSIRDFIKEAKDNWIMASVYDNE